MNAGEERYVNEIEEAMGAAIELEPGGTASVWLVRAWPLAGRPVLGMLRPLEGGRGRRRPLRGRRHGWRGEWEQQQQQQQQRGHPSAHVHLHDRGSHRDAMGRLELRPAARAARALVPQPAGSVGVETSFGSPSLSSVHA